MMKEEKVNYYLELISMPEYLPYDTSGIMNELAISDDDVAAYQHQKAREISLTPVEKRNIIVKQVIKPLLKKNGFSTAGLTWYREIGDSYLIIHMMNSQFNSNSTGASFRFHISASKKDEIKEQLSKQWIYNQACELNQFDFLPYCGMLSPYYSGGMYKIDGYKNFLPSNRPIEQICRQIGADFETWILPELCRIKSYENFSELRSQKLKQHESKEVKLLRYYYAAQSTAANPNKASYKMLVAMKKELGLSEEAIRAHIDWLDICRENSSFTKVDAKEWALRTSLD
ncbi:DUF4304 domain-containing protein [Enterococcus sp. LJL128]